MDFREAIKKFFPSSDSACDKKNRRKEKSLQNLCKKGNFKCQKRKIEKPEKEKRKCSAQ